MAAEKSKNAAYERLRKAIKEHSPARAYLFYGEESYLRQTYVQQLQELLIPKGSEDFNLHRLSGGRITAQEVADAVETMPMMAQSTMVTVTDWDIFKLDEVQRRQFIDLLEDLPEYCTVVLIYDTVPYKPDKKMKKLMAAVDKNVEVVEFQGQSRDALVRWLQKRFRALGHDIDQPTADYMLFYCGSMMDNLIGEVNKVAAYAKKEPITTADIDAVAEPVLDARIFDMTNHISAGKYDKAASVLGDLLRMQTEPIIILGAIGKELRRLYTARMALDGGKDRFWLMELWQMRSDYPAKLLLQAARNVDHEWCKRSLTACQTLDRRMKSEKNIDREGELVRFVVELAGRGRSRVLRKWSWWRDATTGTCFCRWWTPRWWRPADLPFSTIGKSCIFCASWRKSGG